MTEAQCTKKIKQNVHIYGEKRGEESFVRDDKILGKKL